VVGVTFRFLDGVTDSHHEISHHSNDAEKLRQYAVINRWHVEQYGYLLRRLRDMKEGEGSVLDNSMILFGSALSDGNKHDPHRLPLVVGGLKRVLNRPFHLIGRSTQILPNNWKLYFENVKDTYHASILHSFLTTFRINRLSMPGSINISDDGGHHFSQAKLDYAAEDADYKAAQLRSDTDLKLRDPSIIQAFDEYGDQVSVQILTVFPNMVLQQIRNTIAVRVLRPRGVDRSELEWVHLGFADDDEAMTERRLRHGNLVGPAGYIALEDGCVGGFVQRALQYNDDDSGIVMMGGHDAESQTFRASEAAIRGFWKKYRALTGA